MRREMMMKDQLEQAGIDVQAQSVRALVSEYTDDKRALGAINGAGLMVALVRDYRRLLGDGLYEVADEANRSAPSAQQPHGNEDGHRLGAVKAISAAPPHSPPLRADAGHLKSADKAAGSAPAPRDPSPANRAAAARDMMRTATVLDTFRITMRQGSMIPVGDLYVSSYGRLINALGKRAWVSSREHNMICLLKAEAEKQAHIPDAAKTRDIFDAATVDRLLVVATTMATPKIGDNHA